ncbi:MAG: 4-vinyl reductase [Nannocystaceae bacterium]
MHSVDPVELRRRLALRYNAATFRRVIAGKDVIIHCHHYNSRIQRTVESAAEIDGHALLVATAAEVFSEHLRLALEDDDDLPTRWAMAALLYAHLGYGRLDLDRIDEGEVTGLSSHFVEGWLSGLGSRDRPVCSFTEGYIQGVVHAITGEPVTVREVECIATGATCCRFVVEPGGEATRPSPRAPFPFTPRPAEGYLHSADVDEQAIIDAVVRMPIAGGDDGLIPAFSVYLANTPADFYNLLSIRFIEAMAARGRERTARRLLIDAGEICAMNTFRGIMSSVEWEGLIAPMIRGDADKLHALIAVSNALGWGNWHIRDHTPGLSLTLESLNGYEAIGLRELRGAADAPICCMLTGVAAGLMELIYSEGTIEERFGTFSSIENTCICSGGAACQFAVERVE